MRGGSAGGSTLGAVLWLGIELDTLDGCVAAVLSQLKIKSLSLSLSVQLRRTPAPYQEGAVSYSYLDVHQDVAQDAFDLLIHLFGTRLTQRDTTSSNTVTTLTTLVWKPPPQDGVTRSC